MPPEELSKLQLKLAEIEGKIDATFASAEKTRKYMMWTAIVTVAVIVIPLLILPFVLPAFFSSLALPAGF
jgi:type II secretory pathway component PulF